MEQMKFVRTAIYCRISLDRMGDQRKVTGQEEDCRALCARLGWHADDQHVYVDNSKSAWQRNRRRPGWDALLQAVDRGEVDAIAVYHGDRLIRQPWDLEVLLSLADQRGILLASPTGTRRLDNADDRFILRIEAAAACREVDSTSRRTRDAASKAAKKGLPRVAGLRPYGYARDGVTIVDDEATIIREIAGRVLGGERMGGICRDLNARGVRTSTGGEWSHGGAKKLLCSPRVAGRRTYLGKDVGTAVWPPILDHTTWLQVCAVLEDKAAAFDYVTNARVYLLTGIALCDPCGSPVVIRHNTRQESLRGYGCINPSCTYKVHRQVRHVDEYVIGHILMMAADPVVLAGLAQPAESGAGLAEELRRLGQQRKATLAAFVGGDPSDLRDALTVITTRAGEVRAELAAVSRRHVLTGLEGLTRGQWDGLALDRRRAIVAGLVTVRLRRTGRRGPGFDPDSVVVTPRR